jgi:predicted RNase H-like HicB family nuclease
MAGANAKEAVELAVEMYMEEGKTCLVARHWS